MFEINKKKIKLFSEFAECSIHRYTNEITKLQRLDWMLSRIQIILSMSIPLILVSQFARITGGQQHFLIIIQNIAIIFSLCNSMFVIAREYFEINKRIYRAQVQLNSYNIILDNMEQFYIRSNEGEFIENNSLETKYVNTFYTQLISIRENDINCNEKEVEKLCIIAGIPYLNRNHVLSYVYVTEDNITIDSSDILEIKISDNVALAMNDTDKLLCNNDSFHHVT